MSRVTFGMDFEARDRTGSAINSALNRFRSFSKIVTKPLRVSFNIARGGLGFLRDINLGLRPAIRGLDNLIERGAGLESIRKSFSSLTGTMQVGTARMARSLVNAAHGTITLKTAMSQANRAIVAGLGRELPTVLDFVARRTAATGEAADVMLEKMITGLIRGSPRILDDFGLIMDGLEGVADAYDRISGQKGSFLALPESAQQAIVVAQAMQEMRDQVKTLGISGKETRFVWAGIKNEFTNASGQLALNVLRSKELRKALEAVRTTLAGINAFMEKGGGLKELLTGEGGLLNIGKAFAIDIGENIGRIAPILFEGLVDAFGKISDFFKPIFADPLGEATKAIKFLSDQIGALSEIIGGFIAGFAVDETGQLTRVGKMLGAGEPRGAPITTAGKIMETVDTIAANAWGPLWGMIEVSMRGWTKAMTDAGFTIARALGEAVENKDTKKARLAQEDAAKRIWKMVMPRMTPDWLGGGGVIAGAAAEPTMLDRISGAIGFGRSAAAVQAFRGKFKEPKAAGPMPTEAARVGMSLTLRAQDLLHKQIAARKHDLANIERGGGFARQEAMKEAGRRIVEMRKGGFAVKPSDERRIRAELLKAEIDDRKKKVEAEIRAMEDELRASGAIRGLQRGIRDPRLRGNREPVLQEMAKSAGPLITKLDQLIAALNGGQAQIRAMP